ncbi:MAG: MgtC/SapB family protein [Acidobacteriota bacterium]
MGVEWLQLLGEPSLKILLAITLSGIIGYEREISDKPAGLRTNILIGLGSAVMMMISIHVASHFGGGLSDPSRIAAQVVTGVGFLGAGTILQARGSVIGLTSAATIWAVAGIGLAVGSGMYLLAIMMTVAILGVLWIVGRVQHRLLGKWSTECIDLRVGDPAQLLRVLHGVHTGTSVRVETLDVRESDGGYRIKLCFYGSERERGRVHTLLDEAAGIERMDSRPDREGKKI